MVNKNFLHSVAFKKLKTRNGESSSLSLTVTTEPFPFISHQINSHHFSSWKLPRNSVPIAPEKMAWTVLKSRFYSPTLNRKSPELTKSSDLDGFPAATANEPKNCRCSETNYTVSVWLSRIISLCSNAFMINFKDSSLSQVLSPPLSLFTLEFHRPLRQVFFF